MEPPLVVERFVGLNLGGARSNRTCVTVLGYYPKQKKLFVVDVYESVGDVSDNADSADEALLALLNELHSDVAVDTLAVDVPLTLPPCMVSCLPQCTGNVATCVHPEVQRMQQWYVESKKTNPHLRPFVPYVQRLCDVYYRYFFSHIPNLIVDDTMGSNLAPLALRMQYLRRHLPELQLIEVWPKLALVVGIDHSQISQDDILQYKNIETGLEIRERLLQVIVGNIDIFIYDRDYKKILLGASAFESFICALVAFKSKHHSMRMIDPKVLPLNMQVSFPKIPSAL